MSSSTDLPNDNQANISSFKWTSAGTARHIFSENLKNIELKEQISPSQLSSILIHLKQLFTDSQLGSEFFFQAYDWLSWEIKSRSLSIKINSDLFATILTFFLLLRQAVQNGNTCLPIEKINKKVSEIFQQIHAKNDNISDAEIQQLITQTYVFIRDSPVFIHKNSNLYFQKYWVWENQLVKLLQSRSNFHLDSIEEDSVNGVLKTVLAKHPVRFNKIPIELSEEQLEAVKKAVSSPFLIISGGPGTGKTSVAVTLLRVLKRLGLADNPGLAAPTGRAAKRMAESVSESLHSIENLQDLDTDKELLEQTRTAQTIHRLLSYHAGFQSFQRDQNDPLEHDLLIVDEASMIDLKLMTALLSACNSNIPYQKSVPRLIFLGDAQQLPAVGTGAVLSELTMETHDKDEKQKSKNPVPVVQLRKSYRQKSSDPSGRNILGVAEKINRIQQKNKTEELFIPINKEDQIITQLNSVDEFEKQYVCLLNRENDQNRLNEFCEWWLKHFLSDEKFLQLCQKEYSEKMLDSQTSELDQIFNLLNTFKILTATRVFPTGSLSINKIIKKKWLDKNSTSVFNGEHYAGEPVMVTQNQYSKNLFNGDHGIFLKFKNQKTDRIELKVIFLIEGSYYSFYDHELQHLQTSYAITVHKSQGSEYNHVCLILPSSNILKGAEKVTIEAKNELLSREMLYTALTRAKKSVLILGEQSILESSMLQDNKRHSGLRAALNS